MQTTKIQNISNLPISIKSGLGGDKTRVIEIKPKKVVRVSSAMAEKLLQSHGHVLKLHESRWDRVVSFAQKGLPVWKMIQAIAIAAIAFILLLTGKISLSEFIHKLF